MIPRRFICSSTYYTLSYKVQPPFIGFSTSSSCNYSSSRVRDDSKNVRVSVWWDFENCQIPAKTSAFEVTKIITAAVRANGIHGPIQITAFGDVFLLRREHQVALTMTGVKINHVPNGHKNSADMSLLGDVMRWVSKNPPPAHLFFISDDCDFACTLHDLRMSNYNILLACRGTSTNPLTTAASVMWQWGSLLKGIDLKGKQMNNFPHASYGYWFENHKATLKYPLVMEDQTLSSDDLVEEFSDAVSPSCSRIRPIPVELFNQIFLIVKSNPQGIFLRQFKEELQKLYPDIDNDYYGYKTLSNFLASMPNVLEVRPSGGDFVVQTSTKLVASSRPVYKSLPSLDKDRKLIAANTSLDEHDSTKSNHLGDLSKSKSRLRSLFSIEDIVSDGVDSKNTESAEPLNSHDSENEELAESLTSCNSENYSTKSEETVSEFEGSDEQLDIITEEIALAMREESTKVVRSDKCLNEEMASIVESETSEKYVKKLMETVKTLDFEKGSKKTNKTGNRVESVKKGKKKKIRKQLSDCENLIVELLMKHPDGYHMGLFKRDFLEKYGYEMNLVELGHPNVSSLFKNMPAAMVDGHMVYPNFEKHYSISDSDPLSDSDSLWDELGPITRHDIVSNSRPHEDGCSSDPPNLSLQANTDHSLSESDHENVQLKHTHEADQDYFIVDSEEDASEDFNSKQVVKEDYFFISSADEDLRSKQGMKDDYSLSDSEGEDHNLGSTKHQVKKEGSSLLGIIDAWHGEDESVVEKDDSSAVVKGKQGVDRKGMFLIDAILSGLKIK